nr:hypothetical protein [Tanacetum cinerariifolium]
MSLDDLYNHLKVYEPEVQKKSESNSQNMAFISSTKNNSRKEEVNTASFPTASTQVSPASANIKYEDINQIDEDDTEEMDIKWNMALLSMWADRFWKKTGKKISIQGTDVAGFDKSKVKCFNCHKMGHFARECRAPRSQDRGRRENFKHEENHALVADEEAPTEFALMAKSSSENEVFDNSLCSKSCKKNTDSLNTKITDLSEKLSDRLPEFTDDTITNYSRPSPCIESNSNDLQSSNSSVSENGESSSSILSKHVITFVKVADSPTDNGCSWHMTGNISYLSDYEPYDGGYVSFGQGGGKITGKECIVLGRDFKPKDDTNVLLRTPK